LLLDQGGRLWIGSSQSGLTRVDDPTVPRPSFTTATVNSSLASPNVRCLIEDADGRIYAGTSRGIDRIDPESGRVKHFSTGEGLSSEFVTAAFRDAQGRLWFGTISGLSRLDPAAEPSPSIAEPPPALISAIRVRGVAQHISELGESEVTPLTLRADQNQLEIEFFGAAFDTGESLKYQYRLEGIDDDWSPPSELRSVNYGRLPAGSHRFLVRAVRLDGVASETPAIVSVTVLPPIYARWWFIALAALVIGGAGLVAYRTRVAQLLRVERVRARIATDLHDDIGASLSQIAILAEVAKHRRDTGAPELADSLQRIADTSRTLVDSMSDIVWAVNPEADSLGDLVHRMRRFAEDTLSGKDVELTFTAPGGQDNLKFGADLRREIHLMLKESVTNVAKHSTCTAVAVEFACDRRHLRLRVSDNGQGFDVAQQTDGNGLASMRRRAAALGGSLLVDSKPGHGTTIVFELVRRPASGDAPETRSYRNV
jgi:signal transduction histidine kinase